MPVSGLEIPFEVRMAPFVEQARYHGIRWARRMGMVKSDEAADYWHAAMMPELACLHWAQANQRSVELAVDLMTFYFFLDDQFDVALGWDPQAVLRVVEPLNRITFTGGVTDRTEPIYVAFADIWSRVVQGMSAGWCQRMAAHWRDFFNGQFFEAAHRKLGTTYDLTEYKQCRHFNVGVQSTLDLTERIGEYEVPEEIKFHPHLWLMRKNIARTTSMSNDLQSYEKEAGADNRTDNIVFVVSRTLGIPVAEAAERVRADAHDQLRDFLRLESELPQVVDALGRDTYGEVVELYVEGLKATMVGYDTWGNMSYRYQRDDFTPAAVLAHLEDLTGVTNPLSERR
ncbi:terpene synthase family protein [Saccharothrix australiensis]|uniref:Terpene synthase n=1 Tax=Saccharothrix australiensis TaxID=2072 RepID=A0A495VYF5_9PSEU|nr:hypothetical protein [Saccharothrix australiensis]RKT54442.1 pentalenene synthase [Saccharothrix australiensis]